MRQSVAGEGASLLLLFLRHSTVTCGSLLLLLPCLSSLRLLLLSRLSLGGGGGHDGERAHPAPVCGGGHGNESAQ